MGQSKGNSELVPGLIKKKKLPAMLVNTIKGEIKMSLFGFGKKKESEALKKLKKF